MFLNLLGTSKKWNDKILSWDGVPQEVLDDHGLSYDEEWLSKFVAQSKRLDTAKWDEDGNLIS